VTRILYQFLISVHPPAFRRRFGNEMMSVFDDARGEFGFVLILDGLISCGRQWLLRTGLWKFPLAIFGASIQFFGLGIPIKGHHHRTLNTQSATPSVEQLMFFALVLLCSLVVVILFLIFWNVQCNRRRCAQNEVSMARAASDKRRLCLRSSVNA
jgi:hypothetical protein